MEIRAKTEKSSRSATGVVDILNALLADTVVLSIKTRNCHWNVEGPNFSSLHSLFGDQYSTLDGAADELAERARKLEGLADGALATFLEKTRLTERTDASTDAAGMVSELLADHEKVIQQLRSDIDDCDTKYGDAGTTNFLTGLLEEHEKMAWMLRSTK